MRIESIIVTPELAKQLLGRNENNRKMSKAHYMNLAKEIKEGNWLPTSETLKVSPTGRLMDGQHRCMAIIEANLPIENMIAWDVPEESFAVLDTGAKRTGGDVLSARGVKNSAISSSIASAMMDIDQRGYKVAFGRAKGRFWGKTTNMAIDQYLIKNPEIEDIASFVLSIYNKFRAITPTYLGMLYTVMSRQDQVSADVFFQLYAEGYGISKGHPVHTLRSQLIQPLQSRDKKQMRDKMYWFILAWNAFKEGRNVDRLLAHVDREIPTIV